MKKKKLAIFKNLLADDLIDKKKSTPNSELLYGFLQCLSDGGDMENSFFQKALNHIRKETDSVEISEKIIKEERLREYWNVFFPEGELFFENREEVIRDLRNSRSVLIEKINDNPIVHVSKEMTFSSNVLLTVPGSQTYLQSLDLPDEIVKELPEVMNEEQLFWFDHPVQMGEIPGKNEIIYGLKGLSEAFAFEKNAGIATQDATLDVLLSVSVTHKGLQKLAAPYLRYELSRCDEIKDLNIYIFTEDDCLRLLESYSDHSRSISRYFGVDGKYSRHYNFLKAVNALWKISMNPELKGTFKIDLDQIFPQRELCDYTGKSAFQHFMSPLWGARGRDIEGREVDLSMIAGALVNESDIGKSLYTPDVSFPDLNAPLSDLVFFKHLSMALSTRAELMTRYSDEKDINGRDKVISRIHVTGGTNGILIDALCKYRPFTPSFIGRAEDQAYILSVLHKEKGPLLRYYHEDGLIMRHDKEAFAGESIKAASDGTYIADVLRLLYYSYYAEALPGGRIRTKSETYPFTGSYISQYPVTLSYMRLVFKLLEMYKEGLTGRADKMLELGMSRIQPLSEKLMERNFLIDEYKAEKKQWDLFYNEIEKCSDAVKRKHIERVFKSCLVT